MASSLRIGLYFLVTMMFVAPPVAVDAAGALTKAQLKKCLRAAKGGTKTTCWEDNMCTKRIGNAFVTFDTCKNGLAGQGWKILDGGIIIPKTICCNVMQVMRAIARGDPHFRTWHGEWFDYHGQCELIFISAVDALGGLGLEIYIRTKIRFDYSYIESAALRIGEDILEVSSFGGYALNGVAAAPELTAGTFAGYALNYTRVTKDRHTFDIELEDDQHIILRSYKDLVAVDVENPSPSIFGDSVGLMGDFYTGALLARDGVTEIDGDYHAFGQEWQVTDADRKLFLADHEPQFPAHCLLPDASAMENRRRLLGDRVSKEAAEEACSHWGEGKEGCVYDVMATGDLELAGAF